MHQPRGCFVDLISLGVGALIVLICVVVVISRADDEYAMRVRGVQSVQCEPERGRTGRVHGASENGQGLPTRDVEPIQAGMPCIGSPRKILMGAADQVEEFLAFMLADLGEGERLEFSHRRLVQQYSGWARETDVAPLPELTVLTLISRDPRVSKRRGARLRTRDGKVVQTGKGSPVRPTTYVLRRPSPSAYGSRPTAKLDIGTGRLAVQRRA